MKTKISLFILPIGLLFCSCSSTSEVIPLDNPPIVQEALRVSPIGVSYIDPEFLSSKNLMAFQNHKREIWLGNLDPLTGLFTSSTGEDVLIDTDATPLITSFNGPEFGLDSNGWSIFYTKQNGSNPQSWRAIVDNTAISKMPLTSGNVSRLSTLATKFPNSDSVTILYGKGPSLDNADLGWANANTPNTEVIVDSLDRDVRWIDNTKSFVYIRQTGSQQGQLIWYDTETQTESIITNDTFEKSYSYGWFSPEYNDWLVLSVLNDSKIGIYKDNGDEYWEKIITIDVPTASSYNNFSSPETFIASGKSYISLVIKEESTSSRYVNAEVWVLGIDSDESSRFMLRCDDGEDFIKRTDPESYSGEKEIFIYYNLINDNGEFEIWRFSTGISTVL